MNMEKFKIILNRELLDTIRDRRTILVMIVMPLILMPIVMLLPGYLMRQQMEGAVVQVQNVGVVNGEEAPTLVNALKFSPNLKVIDIQEPTQAVQDGQVEAALIIPKGYEENLLLGGSVNLEIYFDGAKPQSSTASDKLKGIIQVEKERILKDRLKEYNIEEEFLNPLLVQAKNVASGEKMGGMVIAMFLPMLVAIWAAIGGMYTVIDATAGEKERKTLEPLLISPVTRGEIVFGKFGAVLVVSLISVVMVLVTMIVTIYFGMPLLFGDEIGEGFVFKVTPSMVLISFFGAALLSALMSAVMMVVCFYARSFKEAQTYVSPVTFLIIIPGMALQFLQGIELGTWYYGIPILNTLLIMKDSMTGDINILNMILAFASTVIYAIIAITVAIRIFKSEKVIFRN